MDAAILSLTALNSAIYGALVEALPGHIAVLAPSGEIVLVNRAWRSFGDDNDASFGQWVGVNYLDACRDARLPDAAAALEGITEVLEGRSARFVLEYPCHAPAPIGERRWFELLAAPFDVDGQRYVLIQHTPVTERRLLELELRQAQKMEAIGRLASGVAHDFNNLLMGIAGTANIGLRRVERDDPMRYYFDEIKNAAVGGAAITKQLLTFSRKSSPSQKKCRNLDSVVLENEGMFRQLIGHDIDFEIDSGCHDGTVCCGDGQLIQILMNLIVNARDAMGGSGTVRIVTRPVDIDANSPLDLAAGPYCLLCVSDTGAGMDVETQERIFDPFFTTKATGKGTGLGLSTVYGIVRGADGLIRVVSELGRGTRFEIYLPRFELAEVEAPKRDKQVVGGTETVLVVEDEALVRDAIREYLGAAGYRVLIAADGAEARRECRKIDGAVDLLLTDMVLPRTTGAAVARELREKVPGLTVLFMSAHPREVLVESGRIEAEDTVLHKPFEEDVLLHSVREVLGRAKQPGASRSVLVVDDDQISRQALSELINDAGYAVVEASTVAEALARVGESEDGFGVLVADFTLPDATGADLVERLSERGPVPPVVYLSGRAPDEPAVAKALERSGTTFIQKPADFDDILTQIEAALA